MSLRLALKRSLEAEATREKKAKTHPSSNAASKTGGKESTVPTLPDSVSITKLRNQIHKIMSSHRLTALSLAVVRHHLEKHFETSLSTADAKKIIKGEVMSRLPIAHAQWAKKDNGGEEGDPNQSSDEPIAWGMTKALVDFCNQVDPMVPPKEKGGTPKQKKGSAKRTRRGKKKGEESNVGADQSSMDDWTHAQVARAVWLYVRAHDLASDAEGGVVIKCDKVLSKLLGGKKMVQATALVEVLWCRHMMPPHQRSRQRGAKTGSVRLVQKLKPFNSEGNHWAK